MTSRALPLRLIQYLLQWSQSDNLGPELSSGVVYSVSLSEKLKDEEEYCAFIDSLPLKRGEVFLVFFLLRRRGRPHAIQLLLDAFGDYSVSDGSGSMSFSSMFSTPSMVFLGSTDHGLSGVLCQRGCLCTISARASLNTSE